MRNNHDNIFKLCPFQLDTTVQAECWLSGFTSCHPNNLHDINTIMPYLDWFGNNLQHLLPYKIFFFYFSPYQKRYQLDWLSSGWFDYNNPFPILVNCMIYRVKWNTHFQVCEGGLFHSWSNHQFIHFLNINISCAFVRRSLVKWLCTCSFVLNWNIAVYQIPNMNNKKIIIY